MHLVQMLLPLRDPQGKAYGRGIFDDLARELTGRFGGVTVYTRAPATGLWEEQSGEMVRDQVVVYEVMVDKLEPEWWSGFRTRLETQLGQEELVIRAHEIRRL